MVEVQRLSPGARQLIRPTIVDREVMRELSLDDDRIFDVDLCLGKSVAMLVQARPRGEVVPWTTWRRSHDHVGERPCEQGMQVDICGACERPRGVHSRRSRGTLLSGGSPLVHQRSTRRGLSATWAQPTQMSLPSKKTSLAGGAATRWVRRWARERAYGRVVHLCVRSNCDIIRPRADVMPMSADES